MVAKHAAVQAFKRPTLYWWIVVIAAGLDAVMVASIRGEVAQLLHHNLFIGICAISCVGMICYFWLNGVKDLAYTWCYHLKVKRAPMRVPERRPVGPDPRVAMVYCTCDDFAASALLASMRQTYGNYEVVILDDSRKPDYIAAIDAFAAEHSVRVIRRADRAGFKAGNLNHGLAQIDYDYFVLLDSDEVVPPEFIDRTLDYFAANPAAGIVQANHRASRSRNRFMRRFSVGVDSHWWAYQSVKDQFGFMSLLGHGATVSRACLEAAGGFPMLVAEDICLSIEARSAGYLTVFAPDVMCEEEFPVDFLAFKKRHNKWTQGNMEFIKTYSWRILTSRMSWYEKLDIVLFTYSLPLTAVFSLYVVANVVVFPAFGYSLIFPLWMLAPTVVFLIAPMLNDIVFHWGRMRHRDLFAYLGQSTVLYGSMFFVSLRASLASTFGKSVFVVTPKDDQQLTFRQAVTANWVEAVLAIAASVVAVIFTGSIFGVAFLVLPALWMSYMSVMHQSDERARRRRTALEEFAHRVNEVFGT